MNDVIPVDEEYIFSDGVIVSQTDANGVITYANRKFCEVSGYKVDELIGQPHSIVRHPEMPSGVFSKMWETIKGGQAWNGLVKNLRKDGRFYWVETEILPIKSDDESGEITGYIAARKIASRKDIQENDELYKKMMQDKE
ncbi:MAG: PAS domain S-box protein [Campylobacterales bacterium]|nr:PAS domain S-box protein [Campylobacterales bacterium]